MLNYSTSAHDSGGCGPLVIHESPQILTLPLRQQVFQHVRSNGRAARAGITRALRISAGSATTLVADLIGSGMLREVAEPVRDVAREAVRETSRGRPPVALEVVHDVAYVIGLKLSSKHHSAVLCDFSGAIVATATLRVHDRQRSQVELMEEISNLIEKVCQTAGMSSADIRAVGIGLPGIVEQESGLIRWSSLLQDTNVDLAAQFATDFDVPLLLDNDTNMLTLAELWFGIGRTKTDFAVVTIDTGVGMGLVVNNRLYRGTHGIGLELGHTKVQLDGALCRCGQRGCLEAYLGDYALIREAATVLDGTDFDPKDSENLLDLLFDKAKAGNVVAETIFRRAGRYLSIGLSNVVQLFDPPLIIISGERTHHAYLYADEVLVEMHSLTLSSGRQPCEIAIHAWDDLVWARGATVPALSALTDMMVGGHAVRNL